MKKIKMNALLANENGVFDKGKVFEFEDKKAKALVENGFAEFVDAPVEEVAEEKPKRKSNKKAD